MGATLTLFSVGCVGVGVEVVFVAVGGEVAVFVGVSDGV